LGEGTQPLPCQVFLSKNVPGGIDEKKKGCRWRTKGRQKAQPRGLSGGKRDGLIDHPRKMIEKGRKGGRGVRKQCGAEKKAITRMNETRRDSKILRGKKRRVGNSLGGATSGVGTGLFQKKDAKKVKEACSLQIIKGVESPCLQSCKLFVRPLWRKGGKDIIG